MKRIYLFTKRRIFYSDTLNKLGSSPTQNNRTGQFAKQLLLSLFLLLMVQGTVWGQTTLYSENFGTNAAFPTGWSSSGAVDWVGSTNGGTGYTGASGSGSVLHAKTTGSGTLTYSNSLSTIGYENITVLWAAMRVGANTATFEYSTNGTTWNTVTFIDDTNDGTNWSLVNGGNRITLPVGAENVTNIRFRWTHNSVYNPQQYYRLDDFSVQGTPLPTITSFTPSSVCIGNPVTISGTNFTGASSVKFNGIAAASFSVVNATTITAVPASATTGLISVTTPNGTATSSTSITVFAPAGDQTSSGNGSWIGYAYESLTYGAFSKYIGSVTENEIFDRNFDTSCAGSVCGLTTDLCSSPANLFAIRYKMTKTFPAGNYTFTIGGDDGVRLYVNGNLLINGWSDHAYQTFTGTICLNGSTDLILEHYENGGQARVSFGYTSTSLTTISSQSTATQTRCFGSPFSAISVTAGGIGPFTYQWYRNTSASNTGGTSLGSANGAQTNSYTPQSSSAGTLYYYCIVTAQCGTANSAVSGAFIVNPATNITTQPAATQPVCQNATPTNISVTATGTGTLTYQWYSNTSNSNSGGTLIASATNSTYTPPTNTIGTRYYYVIVTGTCANVTSTVSTVIITTSTTITTQPLASQTVCQNASPSNLSVSASGTLTYQWYSNAANSNSGGTLIGSATNSTYTPPTNTVGARYYYVIVTGACGNVISTVSTVNVTALTAITSQPAATQTLCKNATPTSLSVTATGTGTLTYQWFSNTANNNTTGSAISGATSSSYSPPTAIIGTTYYYVIVTGTCGSVTSTVSQVVVVTCVDWDEDGIIDENDLDKDNDGILDDLECQPVNVGVTSFNNNPNHSDVSVILPIANQTIVVDFASIDNSFTLKINGVSITTQEINFYSVQKNIQFQDGSSYGTGGISQIWSLPSTDPAKPLIRVIIYPDGTVSFFGAKVVNGPLFPLVLIGSNAFNAITYNTNSSNTVLITQTIVDGPTYVTGSLKGINLFCDPDGDGISNEYDLDSDGDGCPDAIEGDEDVISSQLDVNGRIMGAVNANGVPNLVNSGGAADIGGDQGQGVGNSKDATKNDCKNYWIGSSSSTVWDIATNWTGNSIPNPGQDIVFATETNNPTVTGDSKSGPAKNDLVVPTTVAKVIGNLTNASTKNLIIPANASLTVNGVVSIKNPVSGLNSTDPAKIQIKAATGLPNGTFIVNCAANSTGGIPNPIYATVQLYAKGFKGAATTWLDNISDSPTKGQTFTASYLWQYFGIPVKEVTADPTFAGSWVRQYSEERNHPTQFYGKWEQLTNASLMKAFEGYEITQDAARLIEIEGELQFCDKILTLTRNAAVVAGNATNGNKDIRYSLGQNIFGNSFTASIDINNLTFPAKVEPTVYLYNTGSFTNWGNTVDAQLNDGSALAAGQYTSIPKNVAPAIYEGRIPSLNGFLLFHKGNGVAEVTDVNISMTLPYSNMLPNTKPQTAPRKPLAYLQVSLQSKTTRDNLWLFSQEGTTDKTDDGWDGKKFFGTPTAYIYTENADGPMQVSTNKTIDGSVINFYANSDTVYTLTLSKSNLEEYADLKLIDFATKTVTALKGDITNYVFTSINKGNVEKRFMIVNNASFIDFNNNDFDLLFGYLSTNNVLTITNLTNAVGTFTLTNMSGIRIMRQNVSTGISYFPTALNAGAYILSLEAGGKRKSIKVLVNK